MQNQYYNKKKVIIFLAAGAALLLTAILIIFFVRKSQDKGPKDGFLFSSDIAIANTKFANTISDSNTNQLRFFTGSNVANAKLENFSQGIRTTTLLKETAYDEVQAASYSSKFNTLLTEVEYTNESPFFTLKDSSGYNYAPATYWVIQREFGQPSVFLPNPNRPVLDATIVDSTIIAVLYGENDSHSVIAYALDSGKLQTLIPSTKGNKLLGVSTSTIALRRANGGIVIYDRLSKRVKQADGSGDAVFDATTSTVVLYNNRNKTKDFQAQLITKEGDKTINLPFKHVFVSSGLIFNTDNDRNPENITVIDISNQERQEYGVSKSAAQLRDPLTAIIVVNKNPLLLAATSVTNNTFLIGRLSATIKSVPNFKYPQFNTYNPNGLTINYVLGDNTATLVTGATGDVSQTLPVFRSACGCDINQVKKVWSVGEPDGTPPPGTRELDDLGD